MYIKVGCEGVEFDLMIPVCILPLAHTFEFYTLFSHMQIVGFPMSRLIKYVYMFYEGHMVE